MVPNHTSASSHSDQSKGDGSIRSPELEAKIRLAFARVTKLSIQRKSLESLFRQAHLSHLEIPCGRTHVAQREIVFMNFVLLAVRVTSSPVAKRNGLQILQSLIPSGKGDFTYSPLLS